VNHFVVSRLKITYDYINMRRKIIVSLLIYIFALLLGIIYVKLKDAKILANVIPIKTYINYTEDTNYLDSLDIWLEKLSQKESEGDEQVVIVDSNGFRSYSCLQFQLATFVEQVKKYNLLPEAEDVEIRNMIMDCEFQKQLARKMIEDNVQNVSHWYTTVYAKGLGKPEFACYMRENLASRK
jgi:hypothetical protein